MDDNGIVMPRMLMHVRYGYKELTFQQLSRGWQYKTYRYYHYLRVMYDDIYIARVNLN